MVPVYYINQTMNNPKFIDIDYKPEEGSLIMIDETLYEVVRIENQMTQQAHVFYLMYVVKFDDIVYDTI